MANPVHLELVPETTYSDRFIVTFEPTLSIDDPILNKDLKIYFNSSTKEISINNSSSDLKIQKVTLYNILGQHVNSWSLENTQQQVINLKTPNLESAIYIVKLITSKGIVSKKIIYTK